MLETPTLAPTTSQPDGDDRTSFTYVSSYKCEDCGKIIAAPGEKPPPICCEVPMRKIR